MHIEIATTNEQGLNQALALLRSGMPIIVPSDTLYGVAALALNWQAMERVFLLKERDFSKALPIFIGNDNHLKPLGIKHVPAIATTLMKEFWPGKLTIVLACEDSTDNEKDYLASNKQNRLRPYLGNSVAIRMPDHPFLLQLLKQLDAPLTGTSANLSGYITPYTAQAVKEHFLEHKKTVSLIIDDGSNKRSNLPSTILDLSNINKPLVLRQGAIDLTSLRKFIPKLPNCVV